MRSASDVLQRRRTRDQKRVTGEYREDREGFEKEPAGVVRASKMTSRSLLSVVCHNRANHLRDADCFPNLPILFDSLFNFAQPLWSPGSYTLQ